MVMQLFGGGSFCGLRRVCLLEKTNTDLVVESLLIREFMVGGRV